MDLDTITNPYSIRQWALETLENDAKYSEVLTAVIKSLLVLASHCEDTNMVQRLKLDECHGDCCS